MCDKMAISAYILKIVEKDPFSRLQMRAKEMFNHSLQPIFSFREFEMMTSSLCIFLICL